MSFRYQSEIIAAFLLGLSGFLLFISFRLMPLAILVFVVACLCMIFSIVQAITRIFAWNVYELLLASVLTLFALSHAVGVFMPETGFDALWYHLPITQVLLHLQKNVFIPELYQSAMPRLGSFIFVFPFYAAQEFGVKVLCYLVALVLALQCYKVSRIYLARPLALIVTTVFFAFHTVGWQASSAYVDTLCALFELCVLQLVLQPKTTFSLKKLFFIGVLLGFSLSTKLAVLFFMPAFIVLIYRIVGLRKTFIVFVSAVLIVLPWYIQSYIWTGQVFYPIFQMQLGVTQLREMGMNGWFEWIIRSIPKIILLPVYLSAHRESFTTLMYAYALPFFLTSIQRLQKTLHNLLWFSGLGFVCWFAIPPLSVRYALVFFIVALVIAIHAIFEGRAATRTRNISYSVLAVSLILSMALRLGSNIEAVRMFMGTTSIESYIQRHAQGIAQGPSQKWYSGFWKTWEPSTKTRP